MIKTFADRHTRDLFVTGESRRFPSDIKQRAIPKMEYLNLATGPEDLKVPPSNRFHQLTGARKSQFSISVNSPWRICFRLIDGDAYDVELTDYH